MQQLVNELDNPLPGVYLGYLLPEGNKYWNLEFKTIKFGHESHGTRIRERLHWLGPADPSSRQRGRPIITNLQLFKDNFKEN
jgi:hypothetical protein